MPAWRNDTQDVGELEPGVRDTDEVRHRVERRGVQHAGDEVVGPLARDAPTPVGDGDERGVEGLEVAQGLGQDGVLHVVLRWKNSKEYVGPLASSSLILVIAAPREEA